MSDGFTPPVYPYARLDALKRRAEAAPGGIVDLSVGTPMDPVPDIVTAALAAGASAEDAARLANIAGGIVVMKRGTATCSRQELMKEVASS